MDNVERHIDLANKFIEMGKSLMIEGTDDKDVIIKHSGSFLVFLSSLMYDEKDMLLFSKICGMFSAKKILQNMEESKHDYIAFLKGKNKDETDEDFIKRINKLRENNGHEPINE